MSHQEILGALNKLKATRNDPEMAWSLNGLSDWTTDAIFAKLRELGVDTDAERFRTQAMEAGSFNALADKWLSQLPRELRESLWGDFPWMSVDVLWPRLAGDVVCADLIERRMYHVLEALDEGKTLPDVDGLPAEYAVAAELMRFIESFPREERARKFDEADDGRFYDYTEWLLQLVYEDGTRHVEEAIRIADVMVDCRRGAEFQGYLADVLAAVGQNDEAIARTERNVERFSDDPWARILGGDVFERVGDGARALQLWREALPMVHDASDWDAVADRLSELECARKAVGRRRRDPRGASAPAEGGKALARTGE